MLVFVPRFNSTAQRPIWSNPDHCVTALTSDIILMQLQISVGHFWCCQVRMCVDVVLFMECNVPNNELWIMNYITPRLKTKGPPTGLGTQDWLQLFDTQALAPNGAIKHSFCRRLRILCRQVNTMFWLQQSVFSSVVNEKHQWIWYNCTAVNDKTILATVSAIAQETSVCNSKQLFYLY